MLLADYQDALNHLLEIGERMSRTSRPIILTLSRLFRLVYLRERGIAFCGAKKDGCNKYIRFYSSLDVISRSG